MEIIHSESVVWIERVVSRKDFALVAIKIHEITFRSFNILQTFCILRLSEALRRVYNRKKRQERIKVIKSS